jgi:hypothetical protein
MNNNNQPNNNPLDQLIKTIAVSVFLAGLAAVLFVPTDSLPIVGDGTWRSSTERWHERPGGLKFHADQMEEAARRLELSLAASGGRPSAEAEAKERADEWFIDRCLQQYAQPTPTEVAACFDRLEAINATGKKPSSAANKPSNY